MIHFVPLKIGRGDRPAPAAPLFSSLPRQGYFSPR
jgi:hypothetical protein